MEGSLRQAGLTTSGAGMTSRNTERAYAFLERRRVLVACALVVTSFGIGVNVGARAAAPAGSMVTYLENRFGLGDRQVRGALGALLVFANQKLNKSDFDDLAQRIPNAQQIMQTVKLQGVVNGPLDDVEEYEKTLSNVGIGQPLASQIAPAVLDYLGSSGYARERDILAGIL
jgi:Protein of unknown function VcgC/VcgE (DUF2780)